MTLFWIVVAILGLGMLTGFAAPPLPPPLR